MGLIKCPDCGCTISDRADICPVCGCRPEEHNAAPDRTKLIAIPTRCPRCGTMVPAGGKTCPGCGSPTKVAYSVTAEPPEPEGLAKYTPLQIDEVQSEKRRSSWLFLLLVVLFTALLAFAVIRIDATVRRNSPPVVIEPTAPTSTVTTTEK